MSTITEKKKRMADTLIDEWQDFRILLYVADSCVKVKSEQTVTGESA